MNQYGVKVLPMRYQGKDAERTRREQYTLIFALMASTGSQANHRARRQKAAQAREDAQRLEDDREERA